MTDEDGDGVVLEVLSALADAEGVEPHELDWRLHDHVDTDALAALAAMDATDWTLRFGIGDHEVTVEGTGEIRVDGVVRRRPRTDSPDQ